MAMACSGTSIQEHELVVTDLFEDDYWHFDTHCAGKTWVELSKMSRGEAENLGQEPCPDCAEVYCLP